MMFKNKCVFILIALFIICTSISCTFATDTYQNSTDVGITASEKDITNNIESITVDDIPDTDVGQEILISGKKTDKAAIEDKNSWVYLRGYFTPYGETKNTSCIDAGTRTHNCTYKWKYTPKTAGMLNIIVRSENNQSLTDTTSTFIIPKSTVVTMNTNKNIINFSESFNLTGRLTDGKDNPLRYTSVGVLLRGTAYGENEYKLYSKQYVRTDKNGYYSYELTPEIAGRYDICVYYPGYHDYRFNRTDKSVKVIPKQTIVTVNEIPEIMEKNNVTLTGRLTDCDDKPLRYTGVGVLRNNEKVYTRTDENGFYNYTFTNNGIEDNTVTVYYPGYHNYAFSQEEIYYSILSNNPIITLYPIRSIHEDSSVNIKGSVLSYDNKPLKDKLVKVNVLNYNLNEPQEVLVDNQTCETYTDENGVFSTTWFNYDKNGKTSYYTPKSPGYSVVTAEYYSNEEPVTDYVEFNVMEPEDNIIITSIEQQVDNIFISGYVTVSENNKKYLSYDNYPIEAKLIPDIPSFPEQKTVYASPKYHENFCFAIRDNEFYLPNDEHNINYVTINYKLTNGKNITSQEILLNLKTTNNKTNLVNYSINGSHITSFIDPWYSDEETNDVDLFDILGTIISPYDFTQDNVTITIYNYEDTAMPKKIISTEVASDDSFEYTLTKTDLLDLGKLYKSNDITLGINVEYKLRNNPVSSIWAKIMKENGSDVGYILSDNGEGYLTLFNRMTLDYEINGEKISGRGTSWISYD